MVEFERTKGAEIYRGMAIAEASGSTMPAKLAPVFARIIFYGWPTGAGLGVSLTNAWNFEDAPSSGKDSATRALRQALTDKIVAKAKIYEAEKRQLGVIDEARLSGRRADLRLP